MTAFFGGTYAGAREALTLFLIPVGGGIPAGVLVAKERGIHWIGTTILYFASDVILAILFEPVMLLVIAAAKRSPSLGRFVDAIKQGIARSAIRYGSKPGSTPLGPLALILIAFGVDPMTGRAVAVSAGHGFIGGWALAIAGDMIYFTVLMASTLWLNGILGDGAWTTVIILAMMFVVPVLIRKIRGEKSDSGPT